MLRIIALPEKMSSHSRSSRSPSLYLSNTSDKGHQRPINIDVLMSGICAAATKRPKLSISCTARGLRHHSFSWKPTKIDGAITGSLNPLLICFLPFPVIKRALESIISLTLCERTGP